MNCQSQAVGRYSCSQLFGYKGKSQKLIEEDNLTTLRFDQSGRYLALGDKAGRLIAFQTDLQLQQQQEYQYYFEFQAQSPEFDTLKNYSVCEEVMYIDWLRPQGRYMKVLTANSHTVNLWKIHEKNEKTKSNRGVDDFLMPNNQDQGPTFSINSKKKYRNPSFSPINSVQISHNEEYIFTADQSSVCLWNIQNNSKAFIQRELKEGTENKLEKSQKITCAYMSNFRQSLQLLGTNKGKLSVIDSRVSFNSPTVLDFKCMRDSKNFLSEIINQYSAVRFLQSQQKIATRDLISVKIWDTRNSRQPLLNIYLDQTIQNHVCELFEAEVLDDKFSLTEVKGNILSGNYGNSFQMIDPVSGKNVQYQLDYGQQTRSRKVGTGQRANPFNCEAKVLAHDYNQETGQLAVSTRNCFFIFSQQNSC